ncbi:MAG TPA: PQQ-binding-like beta-propeller repeat protein, partial [Planctomycetota bacterium]|nr:PQQ-binding-like beta-propeller repeat protein [Planctomycetota bacterium]
MRALVRMLVLALPLVGGGLLAALPPATAPSAPLGSPKFMPSPDRPIGWRGDGTGRYPGATPPTSWERKKSGAGYAVRGILWAAALPNKGVSTPIIVGNRVFVTTEPADLVCLDKQTGSILWIRSNPTFESLSADEKKALPGLEEKLTPFSAQLAKANQDAVEALNSHLATALTSASRPPSGPLTKKREIEKQIDTAQLALNKKTFEQNWAQAVFGFAGPTPVSDGKKVYAFFTTGVSACYDLDGNRKWINHGAGMGSEHGNFASPVLCGNRFIVWANEMRGYDVDSGKLAWTAPAKSFNTYGSMFRLQAGAELVAGFQSGYFVRARDGQRIWGEQLFGDSVQTPIVEGGLIFARVGYPINGEESKGFKAFKIPAGPEGKPSPSHTFKMDWADDELAIDKKKNPFDRSFVASPLFMDGLIYQLTEGGGLFVNDAATGELVYKKVLPMKPKTEYWGWAGASASPTSAGKNIYLMDNQGFTIVLAPGPKYKEVAQ